MAKGIVIVLMDIPKDKRLLREFVAETVEEVRDALEEEFEL